MPNAQFSYFCEMFVQIYATVLTVLTVISMYSPASASGLIHKSGVTVAEWR